MCQGIFPLHYIALASFVLHNVLCKLKQRNFARCTNILTKVWVTSIDALSPHALSPALGSHFIFTNLMLHFSECAIVSYYQKTEDHSKLVLCCITFIWYYILFLLFFSVFVGMWECESTAKLSIEMGNYYYYCVTLPNGAWRIWRVSWNSGITEYKFENIREREDGMHTWPALSAFEHKTQLESMLKWIKVCICALENLEEFSLVIFTSLSYPLLTDLS